MTQADLVHWPDDLPIKSPGKYSKDELVIILSQLQNIRFSDNYLRKQNYIIQEAQIKNIKEEKQQRNFRGVKRIYEHFKNLLSSYTLSTERIGWRKMTRQDFVNWPTNLPIKSPHNYNSLELQILLSHLKNIRFSDSYLQHFKTFEFHAEKNGRNPGSDNLDQKRKIIIEFFKKQLKENHILVQYVKWGQLKKEDMINWPEDLPIQCPKFYKSKELVLLLSQLDKILFTDQYLRDNRNDVNQQKRIIVEYFNNQLKENNILGHSVKWSQLKKEDIINWPEDLPIKYPNYYKRRELVQLLSYLDKIRFTDKYLQEHRNYFSQKALLENKQTPAQKYYHQKSLQIKLVNSHFQNLLHSNGIKPKLLLWRKLKKDDFINWPDHLPIKAPSIYNLQELQTLLSHLGNIRFTETYLEQYKALNFI